MTAQSGTPSPRPSIAKLASTGTVFPGTYRTKFEPGLTVTIDHVVDLDCVPGYQCRGDISVNLPNWLDLEFGNVHGSEFMAARLDQVVDPSSPQDVIDPPADLAAWLVALPGITVVQPATAVEVGGLPATRVDVLDSDGVGLGPTFGIAPGNTRIILLRVNGKVVAITEQLGPENTVHRKYRGRPLQLHCNGAR